MPTMPTSTTPTPAATPESTTTAYVTGDRVRLHGLSKRAELNGKPGTVADWLPEIGRHVVALDSGERLRVRAANLAPEDGASSMPPPVASPLPTAIDSTLYVSDGRFILPGKPAPPANQPHKAVMGESEEEHRIALPAGHWELRVLELDGARVAATLVATEQAGDDFDAWNELKGLSITRSVLSENADVVVDAEATIEASTLVLRLALPAPMASAAPLPVSEPAVARAVSADSRTEWPLVDDKENAAANAWLDEDEGSTTAALDGDWGDVDLFTAKGKVGGHRQPLFVRRSLSLGAHQPARHRSRKLAQARRRAMAARSEGRRGAHDKPRAEPLWKAARARATAGVGA